MMSDKHDDDGGPQQACLSLSLQAFCIQREMTWIQHACKEKDMYLAALAPVGHFGIKFIKQVSQ